MIAIKNMKTPKKCSECPMYEQSGIDVYCGADYVGIDSAFKKRDNCPLTEIVTCKDCNNHGINKEHPDIDGARYCSALHTYTGYDFYCGDAERKEFFSNEV